MQDIAKVDSDIQFSGNVFIFHAFDIGDDVNLDAVEKLRAISPIPLKIPKYFKNYHMPLAVELPNKEGISSDCISCKIHNFGALSLAYKVPFMGTLKDIRKNFNEIADQYNEQAYFDAKNVFKRIEKTVSQANFFQTRSSYLVIQINPQNNLSVNDLQKNFGYLIASILRFEVETLSEHQITEILQSAIGYFRGDLIIIDTDAAFMYDDEFEEVLDLFEFANLQSLELRYFDRVLDEKLNAIYEGRVKSSPFRAYIPIVGTLLTDPIEKLGKLKVDISVITERLESSIKLAGEPYFSELYDLLVDNLDLKSWREGIDRKLRIIESVQAGYQRKVETNREDLISLLITILIFIELVIGILNYVK